MSIHEMSEEFARYRAEEMRKMEFRRRHPTVPSKPPITSMLDAVSDVVHVDKDPGRPYTSSEDARTIALLCEALETMIWWTENPPTPPSQVKPYSEDWAYYCTDLGNARALLIKIREG